MSETPRSWAYTSNQLRNNLSTLVPCANPVFSSICLFEYFQVTRTTKFPFSCRMQTLQNNWLEMGLHPCNVESPGKSRCFQHAAQQRPWPPCGVPDVCTGSSGRRCWSWTQSTAIFCVSFISLLTLSLAFTSPNRVCGYNPFYLNERRHLAPRSFLLTGFEEGTSCYKLSLTFTVCRRDSL